MAAPTRADVRAALHRYGLERDRLNQALARAAGLSPSDVAAIEHLETAGPLNQRQLAERLMLTPGSVSVLIDRLEKASICRRVPHPTDRRVTVLELTPNATRLGEDLGVSHYEAAVERAASRLSADERAAAVQFLSAVANAAAEHVHQLADLPARPGLLNEVAGRPGLHPPT